MESNSFGRTQSTRPSGEAARLTISSTDPNRSSVSFSFCFSRVSRPFERLNPPFDVRERTLLSYLRLIVSMYHSDIQRPLVPSNNTLPSRVHVKVARLELPSNRRSYANPNLRRCPSTMRVQSC